MTYEHTHQFKWIRDTAEGAIFKCTECGEEIDDNQMEAMNDAHRE